MCLNCSRASLPASARVSGKFRARRARGGAGWFERSGGQNEGHMKIPASTGWGMQAQAKRDIGEHEIDSRRDNQEGQGPLEDKQRHGCKRSSCPCRRVAGSAAFTRSSRARRVALASCSIMPHHWCKVGLGLQIVGHTEQAPVCSQSGPLFGATDRRD